MSIVVAFAVLALADPQSAPADPPTNQPSLPPASTPPASTPPAGTSSTTTVSGVTATATRPDVETSIDRRSYSVAKDLNATTGNMADVLRNIPSVSIDSQGGLSLRGDSNVTVLIDGRPSSQFSSNAGQALQSMPADRIDRVEVMTNPPAEYRADGSGGIINLITKKGVGAGNTGSVRIAAVDRDLYSLTLNHNYNSDKLSITDDAHYLRNDAYPSREQDSTETIAGDTITSVDKQGGGGYQNQVDGHIGVDYDATPKDRLTAQIRGQSLAGPSVAVGGFEQTGDQPSDDLSYTRVETVHQLARNGDLGLIWKHTYAPGHDLTFSTDYTDAEIRQARVDDFGLSAITPAYTQETDRHIFDRQPEFKADYQQAFANKGVLKLGYQFDYDQGRQEVAVGATPTLGAEFDNFADAQSDHQAYASYQQPFGKLTILAGLRAETVHLDLTDDGQKISGYTDYSRLYPNVRASYDLGGGQTLSASYTQRIIKQGAGGLDPFRFEAAPNFFIEGNPNLKPQDVSSYELAYEDRKGSNSFLFTLYYRQRDNYVSEVLADLGNGVFSDHLINAGHLYTGGGEATVSRQITPKLSFNVSVDGYWLEVNAPNSGTTQVRSLWTGFGNGNLNWQFTPKDFLQINAFLNGQVLLPQGFSEPAFSMNIGYRHVIDSKTTFTFTLKDPFRGLFNRTVIDTDTGRIHVDNHVDQRFYVFALVRTFGGKPAARAADFGFNPGGNAGASGL